MVYTRSADHVVVLIRLLTRMEEVETYPSNFCEERKNDSCSFSLNVFLDSHVF